MNIAQALDYAYKLTAVSSTPLVDTRIILATVLNLSISKLIAYPEYTLTTAQEKQFIHCIQRRQLGEPIAYIIEKANFYQLQFYINHHVLIPRPETELLVTHTLAMNKHPKLRVLDLGTGSGCIALSLAAARTQWNITAADISNNALQVAAQNRKNLNLNNINLMQSDWLNNITGKFDIIVTNPPYIDKQDKEMCMYVKKFEPLVALVAAKQGIAAIETIITTAKKHLHDQGHLLIEHGYNQGAIVRKILISCQYVKIYTICDLAGIPRITRAQFMMNCA